MSGFVILNSIVFILAIFFINKLGHKSLSYRVFTGLIVGVLLGIVVHVFYQSSMDTVKDTIAITDIVAIGYIKLLQLIVLPLVFISILTALLKIDSHLSIKKLSISIISILLITTALAAIFGAGFALLFNLNASDITKTSLETLRAEQLQGMWQEVSSGSITQLLLNFLPQNIFYDLSGQRPTSTIAVVIISALLGWAILSLEETHKDVVSRLKTLAFDGQVVIMRLVNMILKLTPFGVLALMFKISATSSLSTILPLVEFLMASYLAIISMFLVQLLLIRLTGMSIVNYIQKAFPLLVFAFTSRSSAGSIPLNIKTQVESLSVSPSIANFSASIGSTMGQNGCAGVYPAMLAVMIAPSVGIDPMSFDFLTMLILVTTISSLGVAGVGGGATFAALIVLSTLGLPIMLAALLISIEPLIDMARTALNVNGSVTAGLLTNHVLNQADSEKGI